MPDLFGCGTKRVWEDDRCGNKRLRRAIEDGSYLRDPYLDRDLFERGQGCLGRKRSRACDDFSPVDMKKRATADRPPRAPSFAAPVTKDIMVRPHLSVYLQDGTTLDPTVQHRLFVEDTLGAESKAMVPFRRTPIVLNGCFSNKPPIQRPLTFPGELPCPKEMLTIEEIDDDGDTLMEVERIR